jgi:hypothetical protein
MAKELASIDIGNLPELLRIAEEVSATGAPRLLKRAGQELAIVMPVRVGARRRPRRPRTPADSEAFLSSAGGWKDLVDTEQLKRDIYASRRISSRPPVGL